MLAGWLTEWMDRTAGLLLIASLAALTIAVVLGATHRTGPRSVVRPAAATLTPTTWWRLVAVMLLSVYMFVLPPSRVWSVIVLFANALVLMGAGLVI
ncbi:hypothetical protein GCM10027174_40110 [Salinifilum aidingensis]